MSLPSPGRRDGSSGRPGPLLFGTETRALWGGTGLPPHWQHLGFLRGADWYRSLSLLLMPGGKKGGWGVAGGTWGRGAAGGTHARCRRSCGRCRAPAPPARCSRRSVPPRGRRNPARSPLPHGIRPLSTSPCWGGGEAPEPPPPWPGPTGERGHGPELRLHLLGHLESILLHQAVLRRRLPKEGWGVLGTAPAQRGGPMGWGGATLTLRSFLEPTRKRMTLDGSFSFRASASHCLRGHRHRPSAALSLARWGS